MKNKLTLMLVLITSLSLFSAIKSQAATNYAQDQVFYQNAYDCAAKALMKGVDAKELVSYCSSTTLGVSKLEMQAINAAIKDNSTPDTPPATQPVSDKVPMQAQTYTKQTDFGSNNIINLHYLRLTSLADGPMIINAVKVNRGNCHPVMYHKPQLQYGQYADISVGQDCVIREVNVDTNQGSYTFTFNP